ncbi:MAG: outer membrane protein assembly factor [Vicinamibacterales bacterium]
MTPIESTPAGAPRQAGRFDAREEPDKLDGLPVASFELVGVRSVSRSRLVSGLATRRPGLLGMGRKSPFNRARFEADLRRIERFYADRGFPNARVVSASVRPNVSNDAVRIEVLVEEGEPVLVAAVRFEGFEAIPADALERLEKDAELEVGQPLDVALLAVARERAANLLGERGYPWPEVTSTEQAGPGGVIVTIRAVPGTRASFGEVEITGNDRVRDEVIRRELAYRPGQPFRRSLVMRSQRNLRNLEIFDFANIQVLDDRKAEAEAPTRVTVAEGKPRRLEFAFGYGTEDHFRASAEWTNRSFFGGARRASVLGKWSSLDRGVRASFHEPHLFGSRGSFEATPWQWHESEPAYRVNTSGLRLILSRPLSAVSGVSLSYSNEFTSSRISNEALSDLALRDRLIALGLDPTTGVQDGRVSAMKLELSRITAGPSLVDPSSGSYLSFSAEAAGGSLRGDYRFVNIVAEGRSYVRAGDRVVVGAKLRAGSIRPAGGLEEQVPFHKRYFLGGSTSLRGWGRYEVSPLSGSGLPIGGFTVVEGSVEVRVGLGRNLAAVFFVDGGEVHDTAWRLEWRRFRFDAGPGLRYLTPVGPLRVDVGFQLNPLEGLLLDGKPETRHWRIHFSIGQAF